MPAHACCEDFMFTHLSGWKSRVEIDQRAREGRLRQEWREAPHENNPVSILVIFWSVLGLVAGWGSRRNQPYLRWKRLAGRNNVAGRQSRRCRGVDFIR